MVSQTWTDGEYYDQEPHDGDDDPDYYDEYYDQDYEDAAQARASTMALTVVLIVGVVACSCLSCLIGTGIGFAVWEEVNYTPEPPYYQPYTMGTSSRTWRTTDVVNAFLAAGLECVDPQPMPQDASVAPFVATEATRFLIPSLCETCSGRIYSFDNPADLETARAYYVTLGEADAQFFSWVFVRDNLLVQLHGDLPEDWARRYESALMNMT
jgi:hypothetical protein